MMFAHQRNRHDENLHVSYSDNLRECYYYEQQQKLLPDDESGAHDVLMTDGDKSSSSSSERLDQLRESVGDFGLALFAPLLDLEGGSSRRNKKGGVATAAISHTPTKQNSSSITIQTEPESDQYQTEEDDDDDEEEDQDEEDNIVILMDEPAAHLKACPRILSIQQIQYLKEHLPMTVKDNIWERCFAIGLHGDSFYSLLQKCANYKYSVVAIRTTKGDIVGGFACEPWKIRDGKGQNRHAYYGSGLSFVFGSHPDVVNNPYEDDDDDDYDTSSAAEDVLHVYKWTGSNDYCQICNNEKRVLCMGGVGDFGWIVSDDFATGQTGQCATFDNPPLAREHTFEIADFEIYGLAGPILRYSFSESPTGSV